MPIPPHRPGEWGLAFLMAFYYTLLRCFAGFSILNS